ncbi:MAG: deoxyguanosinetriphosphate triphosphohydrolase [Aeriscardovia sp.]|nr:deoxyguanosinetriphosphate triphosphohydrolase [Aeriscardovia sp.]
MKEQKLDVPFKNPIPRGYSSRDLDRFFEEDGKSKLRTEFERDRARLIHSSAFRRLGGKTQVRTAGYNDFARNRLTHSLEVAQIGRQIGYLLGCDPDVVDCACLAHDLGHPPFGHNGEKVLASICEGIGGFEANAQTFRILTRLEPKVFEEGKSWGLNLTRASLDACVKYPWTKEEASSYIKGGRKFCIYPEDMEAFLWLKDAGREHERPMECQVMDISDDIAYSVHDFEDALEGGADLSRFNPDSGMASLEEAMKAWYGKEEDPEGLKEAFLRLSSFDRFFGKKVDGSRSSLAALKDLTSALIGRFASSIMTATRKRDGYDPLVRYKASLEVPEETRMEIELLKGLSALAARSEKAYIEQQTQEREIVGKVVETLASSPCPEKYFEPQYLEDFRRAGNERERLRCACDQAASLTDASIRALWEKMKG